LINHLTGISALPDRGARLAARQDSTYLIIYLSIYLSIYKPDCRAGRRCMRLSERLRGACSRLATHTVAPAERILLGEGPGAIPVGGTDIKHTNFPLQQPHRVAGTPPAKSRPKSRRGACRSLSGAPAPRGRRSPTRRAPPRSQGRRRNCGTQHRNRVKGGGIWIH